jgi:hypothetical protein
MRAVIAGALMMAVASAAEAKSVEVVGADPGEIGIEVQSVNDAVDGARGRLVAGESVIHFETLRLPRDPREQTEHPDRDYDVALRLVDGDGQAVLIMTEGHAIPEAWKTTAVEAGPRPVNPAILKMAASAARRGRPLQLGAGRAVEASLLASQLALLGGAADHQAPAPSSDMSIQAVYYQQGIDSYWKPAFFNGSPFDHSGTATYRWYNSGGYWYFSQVITKCNHGSCPGDPSMTYYKTNWGPVVYSAVYPQECIGPYGLPHVCNNDTLLQQKNVSYNQSFDTYWDSACTYTLLYRP